VALVSERIQSTPHQLKWIKATAKTNKDVIVFWGDTLDISQNNAKNLLPQVVNFVGKMSTPASF